MHPDEPGLHWSGFVNLRSAWQMTPFNHFISNKYDINGNEVNANELAKSNQALTEEGKQNIIGLQGQLWSETINGPDMMFYYLLPKLLGLAERAWSPQAKWATISGPNIRKIQMEDDWNEFTNRVGHIEFNRLDRLFGGYNTRIPRAGITIKNGYVYANVENPGLIIRYTLDGSKPTINSERYLGPVAIEAYEIFTATVFTQKGHNGGSMSLQLN
jgi:hexosaminidase